MRTLSLMYLFICTHYYIYKGVNAYISKVIGALMQKYKHKYLYTCQHLNNKDSEQG